MTRTFMKWIRFLVLAILLQAMALPAARAEEGVKAAFKEIGLLTGRGLVNMATALLEFPRAFRVEKKEHPHMWPIGFLPRYTTFAIYRFVSGTMDLIFHPWIIPFSDETPRPWTEPMGLPDYIWQKGEVDL